MLNDANVRLQPSDARGRVKDNTEPVSGTAEIVAGADFDTMRAKVKEKYGYQLKIINFMHALPGIRTGLPNDRAVIVTLDNS
jgi:hypothetical protein